MLTQLPPQKGAQQVPLFGSCLLWPDDRQSQQLLSSCLPRDAFCACSGCAVAILLTVALMCPVRAVVLWQGTQVWQIVCNTRYPHYLVFLHQICGFCWLCVTLSRGVKCEFSCGRQNLTSLTSVLRFLYVFYWFECITTYGSGNCLKIKRGRNLMFCQNVRSPGTYSIKSCCGDCLILDQFKWRRWRFWRDDLHPFWIILEENFDLLLQSQLCYSEMVNSGTSLICKYGVFRTRMWANAQRDGRPAEHRWHPLFNAANFGWHRLLDAVQ